MNKNSLEFSVVNENPQRLFAAIRDMRGLSGEIVIRIGNFRAASLSADEGLFKTIVMDFDAIDIKGNRCFQSDVTTDFRDPSKEFWTPQEREGLIELLANRSRVINTGIEIIQTDGKTRPQICVDIPALHLSFGIHRVFGSEREKWTEQVRLHDDFLRQPNTPSNLREGVWKTFNKLIHGPGQLPDSSQLLLNFIAVDEQRRISNLLLREETFFGRIEMWRSFVEIAVRTISEIKGDPQRGMLIVHPPQL